MPQTAHSFAFIAILRPKTRVGGPESHLSGLQRRCNGSPESGGYLILASGGPR
jgi:hypothetical protein